MSQNTQPEKDTQARLQEIAEMVAERSIRQGAQAAEVVVSTGSKLHVKMRGGQPELVHEAQSHHLGLRLFRDHCAALTYTSDFSDDGLRSFIENAVALCRLSEPDPLNELPDPSELVAKGALLPNLGLWDPAAESIDATYALCQTRAAEAAALGVSSELRPDGGASFARSTGASAFACADESGVLFAAAKRGTSHFLSVSVLCDDRDGKKRSGSHYTSSRFAAELILPEEVGREAGKRARARRGAEKIATCELPIVFDPENAATLLGLLAQVVSGGAIYRKQSFLEGKEGQEIASPLLTVVDDPLVFAGPGSRPFDGDGLPARRNVIVERGRLLTYLLDTYSARKLGRKSNGCAGRSGTGAPYVATSNFILEPSTLPAAELYRGLARGLYVTEMLGFGFNPVTGDFSRGAGGFLIENGELGRPVGEVTISANFGDLLMRIDAIGSDMDRRSAIMAPSLRVSRMTVAGR